MLVINASDQCKPQALTAKPLCESRQFHLSFVTEIPVAL